MFDSVPIQEASLVRPCWGHLTRPASSLVGSDLSGSDKQVFATWCRDSQCNCLVNVAWQQTVTEFFSSAEKRRQQQRWFSWNAVQDILQTELFNQIKTLLAFYKSQATVLQVEAMKADLCSVYVCLFTDWQPARERCQCCSKSVWVSEVGMIRSVV